MAFNPQFKINQMAKDMGLKSKELTDLLAEKGVGEVKSQKTLTEQEFNVLFQALTEANQVDNIYDYMDGKTCIPSKIAAAKAAEAERASIKYKMVEFMADKIGEEFDGQVSGLSEWGVFVELENSIVEGMILMRDIEGDFYQFDEERYEVYGHSTGQVFTIGNKVRIRVKSADLRRRLLDFEFVARL